MFGIFAVINADISLISLGSSNSVDNFPLKSSAGFNSLLPAVSFLITILLVWFTTYEIITPFYALFNRLGVNQESLCRPSCLYLPHKLYQVCPKNLDHLIQICFHKEIQMQSVLRGQPIYRHSLSQVPHQPRGHQHHAQQSGNPTDFREKLIKVYIRSLKSNSYFFI